MDPSDNSQDFFSSEFSDISFIKSFPIFSNDKNNDDSPPEVLDNPTFPLPLNSSTLGCSGSPRSPLNVLSKSSTQSSEALEKDGDGKFYLEDPPTSNEYFPSTPSSDAFSENLLRYRQLTRENSFLKIESKKAKDSEDRREHFEVQGSGHHIPNCEEIRGHEAMEKGDYKAAVEAYTEALKLTSNRTASLLSCRSNAYIKLGMNLQALRDAQAVVKLRPSWSKGYYRVGLAQNALENKTATLYSFKQAIALDLNPNAKLHALCSKAEAAMSKLSEVASLRNGQDSLCCVAFRPSPDPPSHSSSESDLDSMMTRNGSPVSQNSYVATGSVNGDIILWDLDSWKVCQVLSEHSGQITHLLWSKNGHILACVSMDLTISLWKQEPPKRFSQAADSLSFLDSKCAECKPLYLHWLLSGHTSLITSICFTEDNSCLVTASSDKTARLWDVVTGVLLSVYNDHSTSLSRVVTSPDDELIASTSEDGTVIIRDLSTGECLHSIDCESGAMTSCQFISCCNLSEEPKPSVQFLAVCHVDGDSQEGSVLLFYLENGYIFECEDCVVKFNGRVETVEICHSEYGDGSLVVAISSSNGTVNLWNLRNGSFLMRLKAPEFKSQFNETLSVVTSLTFSPCGSYLAGCAKDGRAYVWNVKSGDIINIFLGGSNSWKNNLSWSSDSKYLSVGSGAQTIKIWRVGGNTLH